MDEKKLQSGDNKIRASKFLSILNTYFCVSLKISKVPNKQMIRKVLSMEYTNEKNSSEFYFMKKTYVTSQVLYLLASRVLKVT